MGTINLGKIMFTTRGAWTISTSYVVDDIVTIPIGPGNALGGMTCICKYAHTSSTINQPLNPSNGRINNQWWEIFQEGFSWRGEWATGSGTYYPGDVVKYGKSSYICRKLHVPSENNIDPWYNPLNYWDEFVHGGENTSKKRIKMLTNRGPVGWTGHPFIPAPNWGNALYTWNGNIPRNIPAAAKRWEWNHASGSARVNMLRKQLYVWANGKFGGQGADDYYSFAGSSRPAGFNLDPSWMRDYWNNTNQTAGLKGEDYTKDTNSGMPTVVQICPSYGHGILVLYSNGTVVRNGYGGGGQTAMGNANDSTIYGATQINFPPGTFIVKIGTGNPAGTDDNTSMHALDSEGNLWGWGRNRAGELGIGDEQLQGKEIGMLNDSRSDTSNTGSYRDYENTPKRIPRWAFNNKRIVDFWAMGRALTTVYALDEAGVLWSWGYNGYGQLGYKTDINFRHTDGSTVPFEFGRDGYTDLAGANQSAINWNSFNGIQKICFNSSDNPDNGFSTIYILDGTGHLWAVGWGNTYSWGNNSRTTAMNNASIPLRLNLNQNSANLNGNIHNFWVCGNGDSPSIFVRKNDGTTWGWGYNGFYELTDGTTTSRNYPVQTLGVNNALTISSAGHDEHQAHVALTIDSNSRYRIFTAGRNGYGVLGQGETGGTHATSSSQGSGMFHRVYGSSQYAWQPMYMPAGIDRANKIRDVQMTGGGSELICQVLFDNGTLMCSGSNYYNGDHLNYYPIMPYNQGHANVLYKPTGTY